MEEHNPWITFTQVVALSLLGLSLAGLIIALTVEPSAMTMCIGAGIGALMMYLLGRAFKAIDDI